MGYFNNEFDHNSRNDIMVGMTEAFNLYKNPGIFKKSLIIFFSLCLNFTFLISILSLIVLWMNRRHVFHWFGLKIYPCPIIFFLSVVVIHSLLRAIADAIIWPEKIRESKKII